MRQALTNDETDARENAELRRLSNNAESFELELHRARMTAATGGASTAPSILSTLPVFETPAIWKHRVHQPHTHTSSHSSNPQASPTTTIPSDALLMQLLSSPAPSQPVFDDANSSDSILSLQSQLQGARAPQRTAATSILTTPAKLSTFTGRDSPASGIHDPNSPNLSSEQNQSS